MADKGVSTIDEAKKNGIPMPSKSTMTISEVPIPPLRSENEPSGADSKKDAAGEREKAKEVIESEFRNVRDFSQGTGHTAKDNERALAAVAFLLEWGSNTGNDPLSAQAANGLAELVRKALEDIHLNMLGLTENLQVEVLWLKQQIRDLGGRPV
jgi:hypothetical protein